MELILSVQVKYAGASVFQLKLWAQVATDAAIALNGIQKQKSAPRGA